MPPSSAIPTSKPTRVRVDGLWKIIPIVLPGQDAQLLAAEPLLLQLVGEVEGELELVARPVGHARVVAALEAVGDACHSDDA